MTENSLAVERVGRGASTVGGTGYSLTGQGARIPPGCTGRPNKQNPMIILISKW